jgi:hypothetical protein
MRGSFCAVLVIVLVADSARASAAQDGRGAQLNAQSAGLATAPASSDQGQKPDPPPTLPVSLDRIKQGLSAGPGLKLEPDMRNDIPRFYVDVNATPNVQKFLEGVDLVHGPVPRAGMTHAEFMEMVTPRELYSQAGFGGLDVLTANVGFAAVMYLARKAFIAMSNAKSEAEVRAIREQIQRELAELQRQQDAKAKKDPGRPPPS